PLLNQLRVPTLVVHGTADPLLQLQVELAVNQRKVRQPLGDFLGGRLKDVASLLRRSQVDRRRETPWLQRRV
ncbi:hypothetical protein Q6325_27170, partial [Klebsiella pneumoniae]